MIRTFYTTEFQLDELHRKLPQILLIANLQDNDVPRNEVHRGVFL